MKKVILLGLMSISYIGLSQTEKDEQKTISKPVIIENLNNESNKDSIYITTEVMPEYPGGINAFREFVAANFKTPKTNRDIKGTLIINFVVEPDGSLSDIEVVRDLGFGTGFEAVRILKLADKWIPGVQDGKPVRVRYTLPIQIDIKKPQK